MCELLPSECENMKGLLFHFTITRAASEIKISILSRIYHRNLCTSRELRDEINSQQ
jgi:hypothetical protein